MLALNREAAAAFESLPTGEVHACTDITGFGLIGHATEMAVAGDVAFEFDAAAIPLLNGALGLVRGNIPGGSRTNRQHFGSRVEIGPTVPPDVADLLYDPQTSGGLLVAVAPKALDPALAALAAAGVAGAAIGRVVPAGRHLISVR
jgi:selenide,water dikinase